MNKGVEVAFKREYEGCQDVPGSERCLSMLGAGETTSVVDLTEGNTD